MSEYRRKKQPSGKTSTFPIGTGRFRSQALVADARIQAEEIRGQQYLREYLRLGGTNADNGTTWVASFRSDPLYDYSGPREWSMPIIDILGRDPVEASLHTASISPDSPWHGKAEVTQIERIPTATWYLRAHGADAFKKYILDPLRRSKGQPVPMDESGRSTKARLARKLVDQ